jgi:hypothetical protein
MRTRQGQQLVAFVTVCLDDAKVKALAVKLGAYASMVDYIAERAPHGPHTVLSAIRDDGRAIVLCLYGGFAEPADNGWVGLWAKDAPDVVGSLLGYASKGFTTAPHVLPWVEGAMN